MFDMRLLDVWISLGHNWKFVTFIALGSVIAYVVQKRG